MEPAGWRWQLYKTEFVRSAPEPGDSPFSYRGRHVQSLVAQGTEEAAPEGIYPLRIALYSGDVSTLHPLCDVPFAIGIGYWQWRPPAGDADELAGNFAEIIDQAADADHRAQDREAGNAAVRARLTAIADQLAVDVDEVIARTVQWLTRPHGEPSSLPDCKLSPGLPGCRRDCPGCVRTCVRLDQPIG